MYSCCVCNSCFGKASCYRLPKLGQMLVLHGEAVVSTSISHSRHVLYKNTCRPSITISGQRIMSGAIAGCLFVYSSIRHNDRNVQHFCISQTTGGKVEKLHVHGTPLGLRIPAQSLCAAALCTGSVANPLVRIFNARRCPCYTDSFTGTLYCVTWYLKVSLNVRDPHDISKLRIELVPMTSRKLACTQYQFIWQHHFIQTTRFQSISHWSDNASLTV